MRSLHRGMTLIDVLVGSALVLVIFMGLFGIIRASLAVSSLAKLKAVATATATTRMEYIRSLSYDSIGTVGGIPAGIIPQYATSTVEAVEFVTRTYIEYADDAADGSAGADSNGITTDYKRVKVSTTYTANQAPRAVTLVSTFAPPGIETTTGGGTLQVSVVNAQGAPIAGASVHIVNASTSPAVDVTTFSSDLGIVYLGGAATSTQYQVEVSKSGYSSAQTYARTGTNANPTPGYLTVVQNQTTGSTFAIDLLSSLTLRTFTPIAAARFFDTFTDGSRIVSSANTTAAGGVLTLSGAPGTYAASGSAVASTTAPSYLASWVNASSTLSLPAGTTARFYVTNGAGTRVSDAVIPGNSTGFTGSVDLSSVSTTTYPALALEAALTSSDPNVTPSVLEWGIGYTAGPLPLPNVSFTLTGAKTIGSTAGGVPIYKTTVATSTNAAGTSVLPLEWDLYQLSITGHTIIEESVETPFELLPGANVDARIIVTP